MVAIKKKKKRTDVGENYKPLYIVDKNILWKIKCQFLGWMGWCTPVIPTMWEAEVVGS
jgi:hypothetical protein